MQKTTYTVVAHTDNQTFYVVREPNTHKLQTGPVLENMEVQHTDLGVCLLIHPKLTGADFQRVTFTCTDAEFDSTLLCACSFAEWDAQNWEVQHVNGKDEDYGVI